MKRLHVLVAMALAVLVSGCSTKPITVPPLTESDMGEMNAAGELSP